jgi:hypothetical protein
MSFSKDDLIQQIAADAVFDEAFEWLCERRINYHHNAQTKVWTPDLSVGHYDRSYAMGSIDFRQLSGSEVNGMCIGFGQREMHWC